MEGRDVVEVVDSVVGGGDVVGGCVDTGVVDAFMKAGVASNILRALTLRAMSRESSQRMDLNLWRR